MTKRSQVMTRLLELVQCWASGKAMASGIQSYIESVLITYRYNKGLSYEK